MPYILFSDFRDNPQLKRNKTNNHFALYHLISSITIDHDLYDFNDKKREGDVERMYSVEIEVSRVFEQGGINNHYIIIPYLKYELAAQIYTYVCNMARQESKDSLIITLYNDGQLELLNE